MRWLKAAEKFNVEFFVTADGDDLFCEPELIDMAFKQYEKNHPDFIEYDELPCGSFTYGIKVSALRKACAIKDTADTEMMWVYFIQTGLFKIEKLLKDDYLVLDTRQSDLRLYRNKVPTLRTGRHGVLYVRNGKFRRLSGFESLLLQGFPKIPKNANLNFEIESPFWLDAH
jgi:spore coat polysaccharide biosynthesis protein SpsF (cytidylyltransferase family)